MKPMIKIILGNTLNCCMNAVIDEIGKNDHKKGRHVVIIPDAHALTAEKIIFERLGINGSMNIEAASFTRFARKVLGDKIGHTLSKQGAVLYFKKTINKVQDRLVHYQKVAKTDGFAGEMYAVIASVRNNGITIKDFEEALLKLSGTTLEKAKDVLLLYKEYLATLQGFTDSTTRLEAFMKECASSPKVNDAYFYLYDFDSLSQKQIEIIATLAKYSKGVTIGLPHNVVRGNKSLYPNEIFTRLTDHLTKCKLEYEVDNNHFEVVREPFQTLHDNLFSLTDARVRNDGSVVVFKEVNGYEQYNAIAREIVRLVRREKLRYKDIAVIDCQERAPIDFKEILTRYNVPHFMDERFNLTLSLVFKFVSALFDVVRYGYRMDKVRAFIKSPLFSSDSNEITAFENYILAKNYSYGDFDNPFDEQFEPFRLRLNALTAPFVGEKEVFRFVEGIKKIIGSEEFDTLFERALEHCSDYLIALNKQAKERFILILDEYEKLIGEEKETPSGFIKTLSSSCEAEEIALIPRFLDAVYVGSLRESCITTQKAIFVANATYTNLPSEQGYQAIISALDMERLEKGGIRLYPTPLDRIREERFAFIDLITKTEKLYIGYPEMAFDGTQNKPSQAIKDLLEIFATNSGALKIPSLNEKFSLKNATTVEQAKAQAEDAIAHPDNAFYTYLTYAGLKEGKQSGEMMERAFATLKEGERALIVKEKGDNPAPSLLYTFREDMHTSISQIERYFACPYSHYLQYGLRVNDRKEGVLRVNDVGTFVHEVLERYFKKTKGKLRTLSREEIEVKADEAVREVFDKEELAYLRNDPSVKFLLARLRKESKRTALDLTDNILKGSFEPTYFELSFGSRPGQTNSVCLDTPYGKISFHGKIDRIDVANVGGEKVAIAIDYKTGSVEADLHNVYYGTKLQLYLYLIAIREGLKIKPVGSFYLPIKSGYSSGGRNYRFQGQFVFSNDMIKALDREKHEEAVLSAKSTTSDIIPIAFTIKNGVVGTRSTKNKVDEQGIDAILRYVSSIIPLAIEEIGNGYIEKTPLGDKCEHCQHRVICGGAFEEDVREVRSANTPLSVVYPEEREESSPVTQGEALEKVEEGEKDVY